MVLLEAMAARTTVVASDIDGYREAAGGHAVLVPPGDVRSLAGALTGALAGRPVPGGPTAPAEGGPRPAGGPARPGGALAWASHWSMERLAGLLRGPVPGGHGRDPALSGRTLLGP